MDGFDFVKLSSRRKNNSICKLWIYAFIDFLLHRCTLQWKQTSSSHSYCSAAYQWWNIWSL